MDEFLHRGTRDVNLIILGSPGVGKSAILVRYLTKRFIGDYHPLLETVSSHSTMVDGKQLTVHIRDTVWQRFSYYNEVPYDDRNLFSELVSQVRHLIKECTPNYDLYSTDVFSGFSVDRHKGIDSTERENYLVWADGIILVYSIIDRESFETCKQLTDKVLQLCDDSTPVTMIGNKNDMLHIRQVTLEEGAAFCRNRNLLFAEVSAGESYESVDQALTSLIREVRHVYKKNKDKIKEKPESTHKLGLRQSLRNFTERRLQLRHRTSTL